MHPVEAMLDRTFEDRRPQLVLREVGVEEQPVVPHLVPLSMLAAFADALVKAGARQRVRDRVADVVEGQAAGEVDAAYERVRGLAQIADHEESCRLDPGRDASL